MRKQEQVAFNQSILEALQEIRKLIGPGWGALGRAAEFVMSQRGLHS
jgi:hypothetical protein